MPRQFGKLLCAAVLLLAVVVPSLFAQDKKREVVVYTALDREFSEPILKQFEQKTGIAVRAVYDAEAAKTVGLVNRLLAERNRPSADVFWNNEIVRSIQLQKEGLVQPYASPAAADLPAGMRDPEHYWHGFAARGRVILVNTKLLPNKEDWPTRLDDLTDPKWKGKCGVARPLFGTTNTHAAVLWAAKGEATTKDFWTKVRDNAKVYSGNATVRDAVAAGEVAWCMTDTDDAQGAVLDGAPVAMIYPKGGPEGEGTLMIPNTLVLIKGAPREAEGKTLIDYLLSPEVEAALAQSRSAQIPVRANIPGPARMAVPDPDAVLAVDWNKVYESLSPSNAAMTELFR